jgi:hypothetical protein
MGLLNRKMGGDGRFLTRFFYDNDNHLWHLLDEVILDDKGQINETKRK